MNQLDEWTQLISKRLKSEAELVGVQARHELYQDSAKETFIRVVLEQFLPDNFGIGTGRVIDSEGNKSSEQDIIIYRRDYPQLNLPGGTDIFLFESVLATIQVKTKLIRKTFFEALDQCASMANLYPVIDRPVLASIAAKHKLTLNQHSEYEHTDPLLTARFHLIGRPLTFIYAFNGYQASAKQLAENIDMWIDNRRNNQLLVDMKSCPAVIATQGCFAARNAAPFSSKQNYLFGIGSDDAPLRLIILQLMHALNHRLRKDSDSFGVKQGLDAYLNKMPTLNIAGIVGKTNYATETVAMKAKEARLVQPAATKSSSGLGSGIQTPPLSSKAAGTIVAPNASEVPVTTPPIAPSEPKVYSILPNRTVPAPKLEVNADIKTGAETEPVLDLDLDVEAKVEADVEADLDFDFEANPDVEADVEATPDVEADLDFDFELDADADSESSSISQTTQAPK
jgi:hypothetical protein